MRKFMKQAKSVLAKNRDFLRKAELNRPENEDRYNRQMAYYDKLNAKKPAKGPNWNSPAYLPDIEKRASRLNRLSRVGTL